MSFTLVKEHETNYYKHLVNAHQSTAERRSKYFLCRALGDNSYQAVRRRDWRWNKIARVHGYNDFNSLSEILGGLKNER